MKELTLKDQGEFAYSISGYAKPKLSIESGETIFIETEDAFSGQIRNEGDRRDTDKIPYSNPLSGPIFVRQAKPGGMLAVKIEEIVPSIGQGSTRILPWWWFYTQPGTSSMNKLIDTNLPDGTRICKIKNGRIEFSERLTLPYKPMIGSIGTAPHIQAILSNDSGPHGGNMDLPDVTEGNTIMFPVKVEGAFLYLGDVHAIQGEGEFAGTAIEIPARVRVTVTAHNDRRLSWPRIETPTQIVAVASTGLGRSLQDTIQLAFSELISWVESDYRMDKWEAYQLAGMVSNIQIGNAWNVGVSLPKEYLV